MSTLRETEVGCRIAILNKVINLGLIEKMTLEKRLEGDEEVVKQIYGNGKFLF